MPLTLKQLKAQRDNHVKKIEEYQRIAKDNYSDQLTSLSIEPEEFLAKLFQQPSEEIANIITLYPYVNQILECIYKTAKEEQKRRECEQKIAMMQDKRLKKRKREDDEEEGEQKITRARMKMIQDGSGEGTSKTMN